VYDHFRDGIGKRGKELRKAWFDRVSQYRTKYPELAEQLYRMQHRQLPEGWDKDLPAFATDAKGLATRDSSAKVLNALAKNVPWLVGGSADLAPSTKTRLTFDGAGDFEAASPGGRNLHFGIREHAMAAALNGMALVKVRAYGSTFLIFSDYARGAMRLSSLMELPVVYVFTHDSIGVGEDGPTHQPVEQLASLRAIPGLIVLRPADANEVAEAWKVILKLHHQPAALILTRQALPTIDRGKYAAASGVARGAYVLADAPDGKPDVLLLASGSEVALCLQAYARLTAEGVKARVVSMPSWELFDDQPQEYRDRVLPPAVTARVSVEQASTFGWGRYVGSTGHSLGMRSFGASAPLKEAGAGGGEKRLTEGGAMELAMSADEQGLPRTAEAEQALERAIEGRIRQRTWGQLQRLEVSVCHDLVIVRGLAPSYYVEQLALQGILDLIEPSGAMRIQLNIQVVGSPTSAGEAV
jgi:transketolase